MINILGSGTAYAKTKIDAELLVAADKNLSIVQAKNLLKERCLLSTLSEQYIIETGNIDPSAAFNAAQPSCTDLTYEACMQAIERAGLNVSDIGLILGDCSTPLETIPTESQRLGKRLGIKIPAYDINAGSLALFRQFEAIENWKPEILPDYILCFSSNAPTQRVNFKKGEERFSFSDAAGAVVVSVRKPGRLSCAAIHSVSMDKLSDPSEQAGITIDLHGHIKMQTENVNHQHLRAFDRLKCFLETDSALSALYSPCCPQQWMLEKLGDSEIIQRLRLPSVYGNTLGSGAFCVLAEACDTALNGATMGLFIANLEAVNSENLAGALIIIQDSNLA